MALLSVTLHRIYPVTYIASSSAFGDIGNPLLTLVLGYILGTTKSFFTILKGF